MKYELTNKAREYASKCHSDVNHKYDGHPYSYHLESVFNKALLYLNLIPEEVHDVVLAACWCHDLIEDARQTYNDVRKVMGMDVAEIVFALTNEKGRYRKDRANSKYYDGIRNTAYADFVKICDRIANVESCISTKNEMIQMYIHEQSYFHQQMYNKKYDVMLNHLEDILQPHNNTF